MAIKFSFEYFLVIEPMVSPSIALWKFEAASGTNGRADFYCWDYNWIPGRDCSYNSGGKGFGDAFPEFQITQETAAYYLHGLRTLRSYYYRIMLLLLRWTTPTLLCFADTAILYSFVASIFSFKAFSEFNNACGTGKIISFVVAGDNESSTKNSIRAFGERE